MTGKMKLYLWNLLGEDFKQVYSYTKLQKDRDYQLLKRNTGNSKKVILLDIPEHGNLGDHAIVLSIKRFIHFYLPNVEIYEFTHDQCKRCLEQIYRMIAIDDLIILPGGGFLGTLWMEEEDVFINILKKFSGFKIVVFPQTLFFEESKEGKYELTRFCNALNRCKKLTLFLRDQYSLKFLENLEKCKFKRYILAPDIVTYFRYTNNWRNRDKTSILFCMRDDKEKVVSDQKINNIKNQLIDLGFEIRDTSTVVGHIVRKEMRKTEINNKLDEFSTSGLVVTDRLHAMIFCAITSTPCIVLDNLSKKVYGGYQWFKKLGYIKFIQQEDLTDDIVMQMINNKRKKYDNIIFQEYYEKIAKTIQWTEQ